MNFSWIDLLDKKGEYTNMIWRRRCSLLICYPMLIFFVGVVLIEFVGFDFEFGVVLIELVGFDFEFGVVLFGFVALLQYSLIFE